MLKVQFRFVPEDSSASIHPFSFGNIFIDTDSGSVTPRQQDNRNAFFFLFGLTELLQGLGELLITPRIKKYAFKPDHGSFDLVFEKRKQKHIALKTQNRLLGIYTESQVYSAFHEAASTFSAEHLHRFLLSDGQFDEAIKDTLDEFSSAMKNFDQRGLAASETLSGP